jgi:hypothetical protein
MSPSQFSQPGAQLNPQTPPAHDWRVVFGSDVHALPQTPQFPTSVARSDSQPFWGVASQSPKPVAQATPHWPARQAGTDWGPNGQTMPQPPQFPGSVAVLAQ